MLPLVVFNSTALSPPVQITIVSHEFKRVRFLDQHCRALRWPSDKVNYVGIDPPKDEAGSEQTETGEAKARRDWYSDWWGRGPALGTKRIKRGWSDEFLQGLSWDGWKGDLAKWTGGPTMREDFPFRLPWDAE